ncbi:hypothetical protein CENDO_08230 [Corynebacterium endometrii]|uniref:Uncharacterized protein n=1 Tax=Corynebacterium endometrii TaxID=2488819 RepID=A0A4V1CEQ4_9CORY|nr:hypothetical protein CENDO_08230 [Corynebacterium endometrii]
MEMSVTLPVTLERNMRVGKNKNLKTAAFVVPNWKNFSQSTSPGQGSSKIHLPYKAADLLEAMTTPMT